MRRQGYRDSTIGPCVRGLLGIAKRAELLDPECVKGYLASARVSDGRKEKLCDDLARFYRFVGIAWERPRYRRVEKLPFVPLELEVDALIAAFGKKTAAFLRLLKETGMRPGEAWALKWIDIDFEGNAIRVTPEKGSNARRLPASNQLQGMLSPLPKTSAYVFHGENVDPITSLDHFTRNFEDHRQRIATKLQNPRILQISFKTFRHFKATQEYHRTKDILHVMQLLGHRNIKNTLVYTHLVNFRSEDYVCKVAETVEEAKALIESGYDYVMDVEGMKLFRKRK